MNKNFDCVEMKHKGADKIREKTARLSTEEELKFWQAQSKTLLKHKEELIKKHKVMT